MDLRRYSLYHAIFLALNQAQISSARFSHLSNAITATKGLQNWYNATSGLWNTTGWWNSANCITALAELTAIDASVDNITEDVFSNTFNHAQQYNLQELKYNATHKCTWPDCPGTTPVLQPKGFLNDYYDDEGWWALAWLKVYDLTKQQRYLQAASDIFDDVVSKGSNATCGGIWWDRARTYESAIANELFLSVAAHLANRKPNKPYYVDWALRQWQWFQDSGLINADNNINDGLDSATCKNNNGQVYTYNQGVILGALVELNIAALNDSYISIAHSIASSAIKKLSDASGILHEPGEPKLGNDGDQFKGIFMRNLRALQQATRDRAFKAFIEKNARSIWRYNHDASTNLLGPV